MVLGMTPLVFIHTLISLVAILAGFVVLRAMWANQCADRRTAWFLATTILTSATGFVLPADKILPSHVVGVLSLAILASLSAAARAPCWCSAVTTSCSPSRWIACARRTSASCR